MNSIFLKRICWMIIMLLEKSEVARPQTTIRFGVLFEGEAKVARRALRLVIADFNNRTENDDTRLECIVRNITAGNSLKALAQGCQMTNSIVMSLVSVTSGSVDMMLKTISKSMELPLLQVGQQPAKTSTKFVYTPQASKNLLLLPVLQLALKNNICNSILVYDDTMDTSMIQDLSNRLFEQSRKIGFPNNFLIRLDSTNGRQRLRADTDEAAARIKNLFNRNRLIAIESIFIFADARTAAALISMISQKLSEAYFNIHFVIANTNIIKKDLKVLQRLTPFKITVIKQYINEKNKDLKRFVRMWNKDLREECSNCSNLQANDIPLQAYYIADGLLHFSKAVIRLKQENAYKGPYRLSCRSGGTWGGGNPIMDVMREFNTSGILSKVSLDRFGANQVAQFEILFKPKGQNKIFQPNGLWNSEEDKEMKIPSRFKNITSTILRIATVEEAPFVVLRNKPNGKKQYEGFAIDVLKAIAKRFNFQYKLYRVPDGKYGTKLPNGSWNGLIGELVTGKADLAVAAMTITPDREVVVDFAKRYMDYSVGIVIKRSQLTSNLFSFVEPFHNSVWFCISSSLVLVVVFIFFLNQINPNRNKANAENQSNCTVGEVLWFAYSSLMQQGLELRRTTFPVQVVIGFWWLFTLIVVSSYTANLAAFLTVQRMDSPIRSFNDLARQQNIQYGTVTDTSIYDYIMRKGQEAYDEGSQYKMMAKMINGSNNRLAEAREGFKKAASENFAFLWDVAVIEHEVIRHKACAITTVSDSIYDKGYGFALQHGSQYRDELSHGILALQENGDMDKMRKKWWPMVGKCTLSNEASSPRGAELTLDNFMGIFFVLVAGILIACLIAAIEIVVHVMKGKPYPPRSENTPSMKQKDKNSEYNIRVVLSKKELLRQLLDEVCCENSTGIENANDTERDDTLITEDVEQVPEPTKPERSIRNKPQLFPFNSTLKRQKILTQKENHFSDITSPENEGQPSYAIGLKTNTANRSRERMVLSPEDRHLPSSEHDQLPLGSNEPLIHVPGHHLYHEESAPVFTTIPRFRNRISQNGGNLSFSRKLDDHMSKVLTGDSNAMDSSINETMTLSRADLIVRKDLQSWNFHKQNVSFTKPSNCNNKGKSSDELLSCINPNPFFKKSSV